MQTVLLSKNESVCLNESIEISVLETFEDCIRVRIEDPHHEPHIREETLYLRKELLEIDAVTVRQFSLRN